MPNLRLEICKRYKRNYGVDLDPETEAISTIGAKDALAHLLFAVIGPGDIVASPNPAYPIHQYGVIMAEGHACTIPMPTPDEFLNRLYDLYKREDRKPKMILISFPHNPTTTCVDLDFMKAIVALARKHGTMVVHDFAYADLGFDGYKPPSILQVEGAKEVAVEIFSMSKSYNMAGWRMGFMPGQSQDDQGAGAHQELSRLRHFPAAADRRHHRPARVRGRDQEDLRNLSEAARRPSVRAEPRRLAGGGAQRFYVFVGADSGTLSREPVRWSSPSSCCRSRWWRSRRASGSARMGKDSCVLPSSRTNTGPARPMRSIKQFLKEK